MTPGSHHPQRGSLILVVMCLLAVLGIALASYLAVSNQSMRLSNRGYAVDVSRHLAEMGLERALGSYSANTFSGWTRSGNQATLTFPITSSHYGTTGIGGTVYLRVDNYRDTTKAIPWSVLTTYAVNDYVWYQGVWYLCKTAPPANQDPSDTTYWTAAPAPWSPIANYRPGNIATLGGNAYRCILAHINTTPPNAAHWTAQSPAATTWSAGPTYNVDDVVFSGGVAYRCVSSHSNHAPPDTTYWLSAPVIYAEGVAVLPDDAGTIIKTQLRALVAPAALFPNAAGSTTYTRLASSGTVDSYNSVLGTYAAQVATPTNYSAVLAGGNTAGTAVTVTTATVRGYVAAPGASTSPYAPRWTYGAATVTGSAATGIDLTRVSRSPYVPQSDIQTIAASASVTLNSLSVSSGTTDLPRVGDTISADGKYYYYTTSYLYLSSGYTLNINGPVVIDVRPIGSSGHLYIEQTGAIVIANNATASLEAHFGGRLFIYSQNNAFGGIQNLTLDPKRCILLGTSITNTANYHYLAVRNVSFTFYGVVYMPDAYLQIYNPRPYTQNLYGALSASNIYFQHAANLHYDTTLRTAVISGVDAPYQITEWRELTDPAEKITLP